MDKLDAIWLDGKMVAWDEARVSVLTHTLHYGVGAFEGIRAYKRGTGETAIFRLREHIERLFDSPRSESSWRQACASFQTSSRSTLSRRRFRITSSIVGSGSGRSGQPSSSPPSTGMVWPTT